MPRAPQNGPALGIVELSSIARGIVVADAAVKRAPALLFMSRPVSGGKHLVMMSGEVAEVSESMAAARACGGERMIDSLELPYAHEQLWQAVVDPEADSAAYHGRLSVSPAEWHGQERAESVAIVETTTVCAAVGAADAAVKTAPAVLRDLRLAVGISGKAFFSFTGPLDDVEAAAEAASGFAGKRLVNLEIIAAPAPEIAGRLVF